MDADEQVLGGGRFGIDVAGFKAMAEYLRPWPERVWAIEGCSGIGRHVALLSQPKNVLDIVRQAADSIQDVCLAGCLCSRLRGWEPRLPAGAKTPFGCVRSRGASCQRRR